MRNEIFINMEREYSTNINPNNNYKDPRLVITLLDSIIISPNYNNKDHFPLYFYWMRPNMVDGNFFSDLIAVAVDRAVIET